MAHIALKQVRRARRKLKHNAERLHKAINQAQASGAIELLDALILRNEVVHLHATMCAAL